jgi:dipeptide transport system substrate-binding protein
LRATFQSTALPAANPIPPILWSYNNEVNDEPYDVAKARELLKSAAVDKDFRLKLLTPSISRPYMLNPMDAAQFIKSSLEDVGIKVDVSSVDWTQYAKSARSGEYDLVLYGWTGDMADPDNFLHTLLSCEAVGLTNVANFCDPTYEKYVQMARQTTSQAERLVLYHNAQVRFKELAPWMPLSHSVTYKIVRRNVHGVIMSPTGRNYFYKVDLIDL